MNIFGVYRDKGQIKYKLFGITLFRRGKKTGFYDMHHILGMITGQACNPATLNMQHGWIPGSEVFPFDLNNRSMREMLIWNKRLHEDWLSKSDIPCHIVGAPFVHYRRHMGIKPNPDAKGTIVFPSHSTKKIKVIYDIDRYCEQLLALPEQFHPFSICLHPHDIREYQMDKEYEKRGFKTLCAGLDPNRPFYEVFYENLKAHRYASSNDPGSYLFYAVEMGIPFFLLGTPGAVTDPQDSQDGSAYVINNLPYAQQAVKLFTDSNKDQITKEQRDFVYSELGLNDCISTEELAEILKRHPASP